MGSNTSTTTSGGKSDLYGVTGLALAALAVLAQAEWPYGYYQFLRIAVCGFSVAIVYRPDQTENGGWILLACAAAVLYNPIFPITMAKDDWFIPDLFIAWGYAVYGIRSMSKAVARLSAGLILVAIIGLAGLTWYVSRYFPHGPSIPTGEVVCQNDDRGPCGDEYVEDTKAVDLPAWARHVREYSFMYILLLSICGTYCYSLSKSTQIDGICDDKI